MSEIKFEIVKDLSSAQKVWDMLTPRKTIYDEWEFRYCFYKYFKNELFFYTGYKNNELIGVLPLQFNSNDECLEYFGGSVMNDNRVLIKSGYESCIPAFFKTIKEKAKVEYLVGNDSFISELPIKGYRFILDLSKFGTIEEYIQNYFGSETRRTLRKSFRKIEERNVEILLNNFEDIELLFEYNIRHFKQESTFASCAYRKETFRDFLKLPYEPVLLTFIIDGEKEAVSFCLKYNNVYESFNTGTRTEEIKNLFAFMIMKNIELALKSNMSSYDALSGDLGWKEKWGFTKIPQYIYEKNVV